MTASRYSAIRSMCPVCQVNRRRLDYGLGVKTRRPLERTNRSVNGAALSRIRSRRPAQESERVDCIAAGV